MLFTNPRFMFCMAAILPLVACSIVIGVCFNPSIVKDGSLQRAANTSTAIGILFSGTAYLTIAVAIFQQVRQENQHRISRKRSEEIQVKIALLTAYTQKIYELRVEMSQESLEDQREVLATLESDRDYVVKFLEENARGQNSI